MSPRSKNPGGWADENCCEKATFEGNRTFVFGCACSSTLRGPHSLVEMEHRFVTRTALTRLSSLAGVERRFGARFASGWSPSCKGEPSETDASWRTPYSKMWAAQKIQNLIFQCYIDLRPIPRWPSEAWEA